jgi:hypothetical protein
MAKRVKVFSVQLLNKPGYVDDKAESRARGIAELEKQVDAFLYECRQVETAVEWLQTSAACKWGSFTQITVIVTYSEGEPANRPAPTDPPSGGKTR